MLYLKGNTQCNIISIGYFLRKLTNFRAKWLAPFNKTCEGTYRVRYNNILGIGILELAAPSAVGECVGECGECTDIFPRLQAPLMIALALYRLT